MDPFAPPDDERGGQGPVGVMAGWMLAFGALGAAIGALGVMLSAVPHMAVVAMPMAGLGAGLGYAAFTVERRRAEGRTPVLDARGRAVRPLDAWLIAVPLSIGAASLLALVIVGSLYARSRGIGAGFGLLALGLVALFRPLYATSRLRRAVEAASRGENPDAELRAVATAWWSPASARAQAALNLGLLALRRGDYTQAASWYATVQSGRAAGFAATGLALVFIATERYAQAEGALRDAATSEAGRHIQTELDGARLLLVLRQEGPDEALALADRLAPPLPGAIFEGARVCALLAAGRAAEAQDLLDGGVREDLLGSGLSHLFPELTSRWLATPIPVGDSPGVTG